MVAFFSRYSESSAATPQWDLHLDGHERAVSEQLDSVLTERACDSYFTMEEKRWSDRGLQAAGALSCAYVMGSHRTGSQRIYSVSYSPNHACTMHFLAGQLAGAAEPCRQSATDGKQT